MSEKRHVVKVSIVGDEYTIRSDATPEHTRAVAEHLDQAIRRVLSANPQIDKQRAAILAALQLTDELVRERATVRATDESILALSAEIRRWLPPAKRGDGVEASSG
jgi:cell division protein ZapA